MVYVVWVVSLNEAQQRAVRHRGGPLLVLAGAGTGKTRVITHRVAALLDEGVPPWRILAVTFTNKAAGEMRARIGDLCGPEMARAGMWVGTFHAICARVIRRHGHLVGLGPNFAIYDTADQKAAMKRVLKAQNVSDRAYRPVGILAQIDYAKNRGAGPEDLEELGVEEPLLSVVKRAWAGYERMLRAADAADFGDLLVLTVRLLKLARTSQDPLAEDAAALFTRFQHVVVDEFQDTNPVQGEIVGLLSQNAELCVVGDDDQSIYGWRGADVAQILRFPDRHPGCETIRLEQNYRSTTHILDCAEAVISRNQDRLGKSLWSDLGEGSKVVVSRLDDERSEAQWISSQVAQRVADGESPHEFAIFYRTHAQSRALEEALRAAGVHYRIVGGTRFFDRAEVKDVIAYLRILVTPHSDLDLIRVINRPARRIGAKTVDTLLGYAASQQISLFEALKHAQSAGLKKAAASRVTAVAELLASLREEVRDVAIDEQARLVVERTGYLEALANEDTIDADARLENIQEFIGSMGEFLEQSPEASLAEYLEMVSLSTSEAQQDARECITMMTVHSSKGLEFDHVFMSGMEDRIFPHVRAIDDRDEMEEERRLAYVAITRARRRLAISFTNRRFLYGDHQVNPPSRFIGNLPRTAIHELGRSSRRSTTLRAKPQVESTWDDDIVLDPDVDLSEEHDEADYDDRPAVPLYVGMQIRHAKFGIGDLVGWSGSGDSMRLNIRFADRGMKTILARFCEPL